MPPSSGLVYEGTSNYFYRVRCAWPLAYESVFLFCVLRFETATIMGFRYRLLFFDALSSVLACVQRRWLAATVK